MKRVIVSLMFGLGVLSTANAGGDVEAGKTKAASCAACHGPTGISAIDMYPNLAGQHADYLVKQLKAFKSGTRQDPVMAPMVAALSDQDMADLGAFFAAQSTGAATAATPAPAAETAAVEAPVEQAVEEVKEAATEAVAEVKAKVAVNVAGDAEKGKALAGTCAACHGTDGNSLVPMYPNIAGQHEDYIAKQLAEFKSGLRSDPVMAGMVAALSPEDMKNLAAYFATQEVKKGAKPSEVNQAGRDLYFGGDAKRGITACAACHSPTGQGMALAKFPALTHQKADYVKATLKKFRSGERGNDMNAMMRGVAVKLTDKDIEDVTAFLSSL